MSRARSIRPRVTASSNKPVRIPNHLRSQIFKQISSIIRLVRHNSRNLHLVRYRSSLHRKTSSSNNRDRSHRGNTQHSLPLRRTPNNRDNSRSHTNAHRSPKRRHRYRKSGPSPLLNLRGPILHHRAPHSSTILISNNLSQLSLIRKQHRRNPSLSQLPSRPNNLITQTTRHRLRSSNNNHNRYSHRRSHKPIRSRRHGNSHNQNRGPNDNQSNRNKSANTRLVNRSNPLHRNQNAPLHIVNHKRSRRSMSRNNT